MGKPLLIYDGKCGFCRIWVDYWRTLTGEEVDFAPSQEVAERFPQIPREAFGQSVQLVRADGSVASGARAVFETLGREQLYESSRALAFVFEAAYRFIARRRSLFYQLTRFTFGTHIEPPRFALTQWVFLRLLAVIYMIAFGSLAAQVAGLIGSQGILPAHAYLSRLAASFGPMRFAALPTVFWWDSSDGALEGAAWAGVALAALALFGRLERLALLACYVLYLSFSLAGQDFLSFQWDSLLLEAGFLAIFFGRSAAGTRTVAWLYRWLVFRLYFLSGYVKLGSHDPTWANLTALQYHYHTQPLPTVLAWYADKLPGWFQRGSTLLTLAIELGAPFLIFAPRRLRQAGAFSLLGLQVLIVLTGNYTFFNLLTMALTLFLFDDRAIARVPVAHAVLRAVSRFISTLWPLTPSVARSGDAARTSARATSTKHGRLGLALLTALLLTLGVTRLMETMGGLPSEPLNTIGRMFAPFHIVNGYGLFAVMTTTRPEIIVEGSDDGDHWLAYEFRYKPGDLNRAPRWVAPYQPRLDWQMWFAALSNYQANPWFVGLALRLLEGSAPVLGLLQKNPFPEHPPRFIRALTYDYTFSDAQTRRRTGAWWKREPRGEYLPAIGLRERENTR